MVFKNQYKNFQNNSSKKKKSKKNRFSSFIKFFKDERLHKTIGLILILFAAYLFIAFTSYLFTWKNDQSLINDKSFNSVFSVGETVLQNGYETLVQNWLGKLGAFTAHHFMQVWFGIASYTFCFIFFILGFRALFKISLLPILKSLKTSFILIIWLCTTMAFFSGGSSDYDFLSGHYGSTINNWLNVVVGQVGTGFLVLFSGLIFTMILFNPSLSWMNKIINKIKEKKDQETETEKDENDFTIVKQDKETSKNDPKEFTETIDLDKKDEEIEKTIDIKLDNSTKDKELTKESLKPSQNNDKTENNEEFSVEVAESDEELTKKEITDKLKEFGEYDPKLDLSRYQLPEIDLLDDHGSGNISVNKEELENNKDRIIETLLNYKINISKIKATIGPTVTLYEIIPAAGVRISKIKNLEDDIALSLSALGIRIIAPMPGKGTVGIEVPNSKPDIVSMKTLIASDKFQNSEMELPVALGKTISNESLIVDLTKMPHLLMAGATGQGKSVGLNAILVSILYKKHPSQVKFVLIDPKKVELTIYNKIERHFLAKLPDEEEAIITDTKKVVNTLNSLCVEMENRYELLKNAMVRTIKEYNHKFINRKLNPEKGHKYMPYIVLVVDEFADLIMTAGKEIETPVARIAQLARAIGIHLIIATQRPSVNVITGTIKANFPARIAFRVTSKIDSRTILDSGGADQLIGRGDLLYTQGNDLTRIQCAFVDTPEVQKISDYIGAQMGYASAYVLPEYVEENTSTLDLDPSERDDLFREAAEVIVTAQQGSASLLQRKLKLGYNRAGRIIDQMEVAGIVGPFEGSKARQVLITDLNSLDALLNDEDA